MLEQADDEDPCNRAFHAMGRVSRGGALLWTFLVAADRPFFFVRRGDSRSYNLGSLGDYISIMYYYYYQPAGISSRRLLS